MSGIYGDKPIFLPPMHCSKIAPCPTDLTHEIKRRWVDHTERCRAVICEKPRPDAERR